MTQNLPQYLAECFSGDARALRDRATKLGNARGPGPTSVQCRAMADACDRVSALLTGARDAATLGALIPLLEQTLADERSADARHVYAGALARLRQTLGDEDADDEDDGDEEEDADDDDAADDAH